MVIRHVYENFGNKKVGIKPIFLSVSHGFRLGKSCHTALNDIRTWELCSWFIKIEIVKFFDKVNQKRLLNILRETIDDEPIIILIQQMFNAHILFNELRSDSKKDTELLPQNSPLSSLLSNIYLHKLDEFIIKRRNEI